MKIILIALTFLVTPALVSAEEFDVLKVLGEMFEDLDQDTAVYTNVNASANTGGNTVEPGGTVVTGSETVEVEVRNVVNGETEEPIIVNINANGETKNFMEQSVTENSATDIKVNVESEPTQVEPESAPNNATEISLEITEGDATTTPDTAETTEVAPAQEKRGWRLMVERIRELFENFFSFLF